MRRLAIQWEWLDSVRPDEIDARTSEILQVRPIALDETHVERYVRSLQQGDTLPALILWPGREKYIIVSGNHRHAAYHRLDLPFAAYVIPKDTPRAIVQELAALSNVANGLPVDEEWAVQQALQLVASGMTVREAASKLRVDERKVANEKAAQDINRRAAAVGGFDMRRWGELPPSLRARLARVNTDEGFQALVCLALDARLNSTQVAEIIEQMNASRSAKMQLEIVDGYRLQYQSQVQYGPRQKVRGQPITPVTAMNSTLTRVRKLDTDALRVYLDSREAREAVAPIIAEAMDKLRELQDWINSQNDGQ